MIKSIKMIPIGGCNFNTKATQAQQRGRSLECSPVDTPLALVPGHRGCWVLAAVVGRPSIRRRVSGKHAVVLHITPASTALFSCNQKEKELILKRRAGHGSINVVLLRYITSLIAQLEW